MALGLAPERPALAHIADHLSHIVISLGRANADQFAHARENVSALPRLHMILWSDGLRLTVTDKEPRRHGPATAGPGKGRNVWHRHGNVLADRRAEVAGLHDCGITTYDRGLLARLMHPVAKPSFHHAFAKRFYPRIMHQKLNCVVRLPVRRC
jgi:glucosyl-3-phosphoglycerate synthase